MQKQLKLTILAAIVVCCLSCAATRLEIDYGTSAKLAKYNQILNPDAEKNLVPVAGLNGKAANKVMEKYVKGFEELPSAPFYSLGIGPIGK